MDGKRRVKLAVAITTFSLIAVACGKTKTPTVSAASCSEGRLKKPSAMGASDITGANLMGHRVLAKAKPVVKIAMFGDLTGSNSALVTPIRNAAALAIDERNAKGDLNVTVQFEPKDNKDANPDTAPPIEQAFIQDSKVVGVLGGAFSGETEAVGKLFAKAGLTHITASATRPSLTTHGWPFFRAVVPDTIQGAKLAGLLYATGCKKAVVLDDKSDYGKGLADIVADNFKKDGGTVLDREGIDAKTTDYGPVIDTISAKNPDVVFYGGYYSGGSALLKQMRERGVKATFSCGDGCVDNQLVTLAGAANANGAILTCPCVIPAYASTPDAVALEKAYKAKYGKDALIYSSEATDAANIFLAAIAASDADGKVTRKEVLDFVKSLTGFHGVSRDYSFQPNGELSTASLVINVYPVINGKVQLLGKTEDVTP